MLDQNAVDVHDDCDIECREHGCTSWLLMQHTSHNDDCALVAYDEDRRMGSNRGGEERQ